jgi:hypothetical protein
MKVINPVEEDQRPVINDYVSSILQAYLLLFF